MTEAEKQLLRALCALEWALGYLESTELHTGKNADLTYLAEAISEIQGALQKDHSKVD